MDNSKAIEKFIIFCLENYKTAMELTGEQALKDFEKYHVFTFLSEGYEVLHSQSRNYIVEEIKEYIENRREK